MNFQSNQIWFFFDEIILATILKKPVLHDIFTMSATRQRKGYDYLRYNGLFDFTLVCWAKRTNRNLLTLPLV